MSHSISRENNFDLIRILAAIQVVLFHSVKHLDIQDGYLVSFVRKILIHFPGVPIFFVVSGFLVYWSFERNSVQVKKYFWHRALRIFPALWACVLITFGVMLFDLNIGIGEALSRGDILAWLGGELSFFQFYTPDVFRAWGVGTPNGSLWTIPVEIQYYIAIPILFWIFKLLKKSWVIGFILIFILSMVLNIQIYGIDGESMVRKFANVSLFPYLYYFMFGILAYKFWYRIKFLFEGKILYWFVGFILYVLLFSNYLGWYRPSYWLGHVCTFGSHVLLACITLAFAFSHTSWSNKILKGNDISYGVYIYHMPIVNYMVHRGYEEDPIYVAVLLLTTFVFAFASWKLVEKRALKLKGKV